MLWPSEEWLGLIPRLIIGDDYPRLDVCRAHQQYKYRNLLVRPKVRDHGSLRIKIPSHTHRLRPGAVAYLLATVSATLAMTHLPGT